MSRTTPVKQALSELGEYAADVKVLGSYPGRPALSMAGRVACRISQALAQPGIQRLRAYDPGP